jgi:hypothetical protein
MSLTETSPTAVQRVTTEPHWTGSEVDFLLQTPYGDITLTEAEFRVFTDQVVAQRDGAGQFAADSRRLTHDPERRGLISRDRGYGNPNGTRHYDYVRPGAEDTDPVLSWVPPERSIFSASSTDHDGRWELRLPLDVRTTAPAVGRADWNDGAAVADLVQQALHPRITWGLYALAHTEIVTEHTRRTEEKEAEAARAEIQRQSEAHVRAAGQRLRNLAEVTADTLRQVLRQGHVGDQGPIRLRFESLPMERDLIPNPGIAERVGYDPAVKSMNTLYWGSRDSANHPVVGWRMMLLTDRERSCTADVQQSEGPDWADQVDEALTARGLRVVRRVDGFWVVRDEAIFDVYHEKWVANWQVGDFGMPNWRIASNTRRIDITKRGGYQTS